MNKDIFLGKTLSQIREFFLSLSSYINKRLFFYFNRFESAKDVLVGGLTVKRGRYVGVFLQSSLSILFIIGLALTPVISKNLKEEETIGTGIGGAILGEASYNTYASNGMTTQISVKPRDSVVTYLVQPGENLTTIAKKFELSVDTIRWQNNLKSADDISAGDKIEIPPVTGIVHKVKRGDTIYSIAKKYGVDAQAIVNWPFNSYTDDENFGLAVGQTLVVPEGIKPKEVLWQPDAYLAGKITPDAGNVSATGQFIWPTSGRITQRFVWYHRGLDIANASSPAILAADSGTVITVGWPDNSGYGNRVVIDHNNGFVTLYAHLSSYSVTAGQRVNRGDQIGVMGSTGRSTGTHLHFEIRNGGVFQDPLGYLQ